MFYDFWFLLNVACIKIERFQINFLNASQTNSKHSFLKSFPKSPLKPLVKVSKQLQIWLFHIESNFISRSPFAFVFKSVSYMARAQNWTENQRGKKAKYTHKRDTQKIKLSESQNCIFQKMNDNWLTLYRYTVTEEIFCNPKN